MYLWIRFSSRPINTMLIVRIRLLSCKLLQLMTGGIYYSRINWLCRRPGYILDYCGSACLSFLSFVFSTLAYILLLFFLVFLGGGVGYPNRYFASNTLCTFTHLMYIMLIRLSGIQGLLSLTFRVRYLYWMFWLTVRVQKHAQRFVSTHLISCMFLHYMAGDV